jgi:hypothetical protein
LFQLKYWELNKCRFGTQTIKLVQKMSY